MRVPIPDDWDEGTDGYCVLLACIPNSPLWTAAYKGAFYDMTWWKYWDRDTGDIYQVREITNEVFRGLCVANCNDLLIELQNLVAVMGEIRDKLPEGTDSQQTMSAIAHAVANLDASTVVNLNMGCDCGECDDCQSQTLYNGNEAGSATGGGEQPQQTVDVF